MRAAVFNPSTGLLLQDVATPELQAGEALLAIEACGVCGSDKQVVAGEPAPTGTRFPVILGHEIAGRIVALGSSGGANPSCATDGASEQSFSPSSSEDWKVGDEVIVFPFIPCGECRQCNGGAENLCSRQTLIGYHRPGGYAELTVVPTQALLRRPTSVSATAAALLVDAFATPFHALSEACRMSPADRVVVLGTGGTGLAAIMLARALDVVAVGAITRRDSAAPVAEEAGAQNVWVQNGDDRRVAREVRRWSEGGADIVLDTVGTGESAEFGLDLLRPGGRLCLIGMGTGEAHVPIAKTVRRGVTITASYGSTMDDVRALIELTKDGRLQPSRLVGHVLPLERIAEAFQPNSISGRIVIEMPLNS